LLSLKEDYTLVSVLERRATAEHSEVRRTLPGVKVVTTLQEVLDDPAVELVVISTINDTHYEYTKVGCPTDHDFRD
jgi:predicted dehydrogenase